MAQTRFAAGRRQGDTATRLPTGLFVCPECARPLRDTQPGLRCARGHRFEPIEGIYDLWPPGVKRPHLDWFATPYGLLYDTGIKERWLARLIARAGWGTDIDRMYSMMDQGVKTRHGEVVLDVPAGGAPPLRTAAGRLRGYYVGIDLSLEMLRRADRERRAEGLSRVVLARGDIAHLPLADASVNRVLCFNGLHVLSDKGAALTELHRVLKPGGALTGNVAVDDSGLRGQLVSPWLSWLPFFSPADPEALRRLALEAGFRRWNQQLDGSMLYFEGLAR